MSSLDQHLFCDELIVRLARPDETRIVAALISYARRNSGRPVGQSAKSLVREIRHKVTQAQCPSVFVAVDHSLGQPLIVGCAQLDVGPRAAAPEVAICRIAEHEEVRRRIVSAISRMAITRRN